MNKVTVNHAELAAIQDELKLLRTFTFTQRNIIDTLIHRLDTLMLRKLLDTPNGIE